jgi:hypothetical protein
LKTCWSIESKPFIRNKSAASLLANALIADERFGERQTLRKATLFEVGMDGVEGHGVSLLTNMSFLKYRYMAKAIQ